LGGGFNVRICDLIVALKAPFSAIRNEIRFNPFFYPLSQIVRHYEAKEIVMLGNPSSHEALNIDWLISRTAGKIHGSGGTHGGYIIEAFAQGFRGIKKSLLHSSAHG